MISHRAVKPCLEATGIGLNTVTNGSLHIFTRNQYRIIGPKYTRYLEWLIHAVSYLTNPERVTGTLPSTIPPMLRSNVPLPLPRGHVSTRGVDGHSLSPRPIQAYSLPLSTVIHPSVYYPLCIMRTISYRGMCYIVHMCKSIVIGRTRTGRYKHTARVASRAVRAFYAVYGVLRLPCQLIEQRSHIHAYTKLRAREYIYIGMVLCQ
jgi:hypothetical protein